MQLEKITQQLQEVTDSLNETLKAYSGAELAYLTRFYDLYLHSPRGNDKGRESEAKAILIEEGLYEPWANLKVDLKILENKKVLLLELLKNARISLQIAS